MTNGENIIYHYIQKTLIADNDNDEFTRELIERLIIDLSIWLPANLYHQIPVLLPYVVRDNSCRKKKPGQPKDEWGNSNHAGYLRDDNSLIKGIIKSLYVDGNRVRDYDNKKLANGFVACHIWRKLGHTTQKSASTHHQTNSFIPNLVWLPKQIAKLTDREGSFAQNLLKTISYKIYEDFNSPLTDPIWKELYNPKMATKYPIETNRLNYFRVPEVWVQRRREGLAKEIAQIRSVDSRNIIENGKVKCSSYLPTLLQNTKSENRKDMIEWLKKNLEHLENLGDTS